MGLRLLLGHNPLNVVSAINDRLTPASISIVIRQSSTLILTFKGEEHNYVGIQSSTSGDPHPPPLPFGRLAVTMALSSDLTPAAYHGGTLSSSVVRQICNNFCNNYGFIRTSMKLGSVIEHDPKSISDMEPLRI